MEQVGDATPQHQRGEGASHPGQLGVVLALRIDPAIESVDDLGASTPDLQGLRQVAKAVQKAAHCGLGRHAAAHGTADTIGDHRHHVAALLNTNTATACAVLVWTLMDKMAYGKPSVIGAVNGMIAGLVAITPGAGYVDGLGAIIIGVCAGIIPWLAMNKLQKTQLMMKVDDTLSVFSTHGIAGLMGGLLVGLLGNPDMLQYIGTDKDAPGVSVTGLFYGNAPQLLLQAEGAAFIIVYNIIATFIILKVISFITPLRMDDATLMVGDDAVHGETAYAIGTGGD
jgi:ammonia channel protein AmtB